MHRVVILLNDVMYAELAEVSAGIREHGFTAQAWATEAVESALASRRLPRVPPRVRGPYITEEEPDGYPVHFPKEMEMSHD